MTITDAAGAAGYGHAPEYDSSPNVIKSVLESLYKQVREGSAMRHTNAANLVAATQAGLVAGGWLDSSGCRSSIYIYSLIRYILIRNTQ